MSNSKDWERTFLWLSVWEKFPKFLEIHEELEDDDYFSILGDILHMGTYYSDYEIEFDYLLNNPDRDMNNRIHLMDEEEQKIFKLIPERGTIYRGAKDGMEYGFSWTLEQEKAEWFAKGYPGDAVLLKGQFQKDDVIAYFDREKEIFIDPVNVNWDVINDYSNDEGTRPLQRYAMHIDVWNEILNFPGYKALRKKAIMRQLIKSRGPIIEKDHYIDMANWRTSIYAFFLSENSTLKEFCSPNQLLYLGITERGIKNREINEHLKTGKTGKSSFRRSVGAILKKDLNLSAIPRSKTAEKKYAANYKFDESGEERLTKWIKNNCTFGYYFPNRKYDRNALEAIEDELTIAYRPTLNLARQTRKYNEFADALDDLREICRAEVKKSCD
tara:strand:- start:184 stop:1338 length:1155 start_codon:yes stop_codon:yes gene_type:complete